MDSTTKEKEAETKVRWKRDHTSSCGRFSVLPLRTGLGSKVEHWLLKDTRKARKKKKTFDSVREAKAEAQDRANSNKPGRPKLAEGDTTEKVTVRFSTSDLEALRLRAKCEGTKLSTMIRSIVLSSIEEPKKKRKKAEA